MKVSILDAAAVAYTVRQEVLGQLGDGAFTGIGWEALSPAGRETEIANAQAIINGTADPSTAVTGSIGGTNAAKADFCATAAINCLREYHGQ